MSTPAPPVTLWYVSLHGASGSSPSNNILSFDTNGKPVSTTVLDASKVTLAELRGFVVLPGGDMLVCVANKSVSQVLHFGPATDPTTPRPYLGIFAGHDATTNPGLLHPFNVRVGPDQLVYVANQGDSTKPQQTNEVTRYNGPSWVTPGQPYPSPSALNGIKVDPGTYIAPSGGVQILRDVVFGPGGYVYVADEGANAVLRYDYCSGAYIDTVVSAADGLQTPVHLLPSPDQSHLYVGSSGKSSGDGAAAGKSPPTGSVLSYHFSTGKVHTVVQPGAGGLDGTAGMAIGSDGLLYVASRKGRQVLRYALPHGDPAPGNPFIHKKDLEVDTNNPDDCDPEFIAQVTVPGA